MAALKVLLLASVVHLVASRFLAPPSASKGKAKQVDVHPHNSSSKASSVNATNATKVHKKHNLTAEEQLAHLQDGLETIAKLQSVFAGDAKEAVGASEMASGAMTTELSNKDSMVWKTIAAMMSASKKVQTQMKNAKNKTARANIMESLEHELDNQADQLKNMTDKANAVNEKHSAEYLLGLLNSHQKDWSIEKQLNTTLKFANSSIAAWELAQHHNMSQSFAPQLAAIMDQEKKALKNATAKAKNTTAKAKTIEAKTVRIESHAKAKSSTQTDKVEKTSVIAKKAAKQFIQLVESLREMKA